MRRTFPIALVVGFNDSLARACARRLEARGFVAIRVAHGIQAQDEIVRLDAALVVMSRDLFSMEKTFIMRTAETMGVPVLEASTEADFGRVVNLFAFSEAS